MELTIDKLSKTYPNGVQALKNIDLSIPTGMFGLLGPNGAGKSTLMRTIATLQEADQGSVKFNGFDVMEDKTSIRKQLGYLPQEFGLYPKVTAENLLDHMASLKGITNKKERKKLVDALLEQTNLNHARDKKLNTFSGGMKQRFGIAQALLGDPGIIIVDEPTAGLDPAERNRFHNLLSEIGENIVVILSTHIVDDVSDLCTNMAIMNNGEILLKGSPGNLINSMKGKIWKKTIDKSDLEDHMEKFNVISTKLYTGKIIIHVYSDTKPDESFENQEPTLEDVYFTQIKNNNTDN
jgi:ABC-type multidrug transport system ATPase subunit